MKRTICMRCKQKKLCKKIIGYNALGCTVFNCFICFECYRKEKKHG